MKTPISYYGGKQQLAKKIISLIPEHTHYIEPFCGGAAVFFAKEPSKAETLNDTNLELINFYKIIKTDFNALQQEILQTMHSRHIHAQAQVVYKNPDMFTPVKRAWALWVIANTSFGKNLDNSFGYDTANTIVKTLNAKITDFTNLLVKRLQNTCLEDIDALRLIKSRNITGAFFYLDPPYVGSFQGHYDGYTQADFDELIQTLTTIKGKFLLSSYRNQALTEATKNCGWHQIELKLHCPMTSKSKKPMQKIEVLTANYPIGVVDGEVKKL